MFIVWTNMNFGVIPLEKYLQIYKLLKTLYTIAYPCVKTRQFIYIYILMYILLMQNPKNKLIISLWTLNLSDQLIIYSLIIHHFFFFYGIGIKKQTKMKSVNNPKMFFE